MFPVMSTVSEISLPLVFVGFFLLFFAVLVGSVIIRGHIVRREIREIEANSMEMSLEQFRAIKKKSIGSGAVKEYSEKFNFTGCYVIHNKTKDVYYVGQSENVLKRAHNHFKGRGSAPLYSDYMSGDYEWTIRLHRLHDSGFNRLNAQEKHLITLYDAYHNGYNKTRGNNHL